MFVFLKCCHVMSVHVRPGAVTGETNELQPLAPPERALRLS